ncbi:MAG: DUF370 domain-containing protein [Clostridia bacterium]|nr:DUF370 domain-containing protein [Clostridia bacterium]
MFLHLGSNVSIPTKNILGVFDLELTTTTGTTREVLKKAENEGRVVNVSEDMPTSFVVVREILSETGEEVNFIYLTPISASTLRKRVMLY